MDRWIWTFPELERKEALQEELIKNRNLRRGLFRIFNNAGEAAAIRNKHLARRLLESIRLDAYRWIDERAEKADLLWQIFDPDGIQERPDVYGELYGVVRNLIHNLTNRVGGTFDAPTGKNEERHIGRSRIDETDKAKEMLALTKDNN